jgi:hypothetical protein
MLETFMIVILVSFFITLPRLLIQIINQFAVLKVNCLFRNSFHCFSYLFYSKNIIKLFLLDKLFYKQYTNFSFDLLQFILIKKKNFFYKILININIL